MVVVVVVLHSDCRTSPERHTSRRRILSRSPSLSVLTSKFSRCGKSEEEEEAESRRKQKEAEEGMQK